MMLMVTVIMMIMGGRGTVLTSRLSWMSDATQVNRELAQLKDINVELAYDGLSLDVVL